MVLLPSVDRIVETYDRRSMISDTLTRTGKIRYYDVLY